MIHRVFEEYLHRLHLAADKYQFRDAIAGFIAEFELHSFAYITIPRTVKHKMRVISTYAPEWVGHYRANQYWRCDPVIGWVRRRPKMFDWGPDLACPDTDGVGRKFFNEAAGFGIEYGLTIPIEENGVTVSSMTFASDRRRASYRACIHRHAPVIQFASYCFHAHVRRNLNRSYAPANVSLTPRQQQCIDLCAIGKTCPDIAELLKLKLRTVIYHVQNAKMKLRARTIGQATASLHLTRND